MKKLAEAIYSGLLVAVPSLEVYRSVAPSDAAFPYVVFHMDPSEVGEYISGATLTAEEVYDVQFSVFAVLDITAMDALETIRDHFENNKVTVVNETCQAVYKSLEWCEVDPDKDQAGNNVWHGILLLEFWMSKGV